MSGISFCNKYHFLPYTYRMLELTKGHLSENMILTLNEKRTINSGYYLFVFTHILTRAVVTAIVAFIDDQSAYQDRFNKFEINSDSVFGNSPVGQYEYQVYEQASSSNTDPAGLNEVESGIMVLRPAADFEFEQYDSPTTFKSYNG